MNILDNKRDWFLQGIGLGLVAVFAYAVAQLIILGVFYHG